MENQIEKNLKNEMISRPRFHICLILRQQNAHTIHGQYVLVIDDH